MIKFLKIFVPLFVFLAGIYTFPNLSAAQGTEYTLLAPLPIEGVTAGDKITAGPYIEGLFTLIIVLAGVLAVVMIIIGGIQYMSTDAFSGKNDAKKRIENAIWGLMLVIGSWLILYTINPDLVTINLSIPTQDLATTTSAGGGAIEKGPSFGLAWEDDKTTRDDLLKSGIGVNLGNCATIGQTSCTSVTGLSSGVISGLKSLKTSCGASCVVTISGGTEFWLHGNKYTEIGQNPTAHKPGGNVVDLSMTSVSNYIRTKGTKTSAAGCSELSNEKYVLGGATYVYEPNPPHWHVCF